MVVPVGLDLTGLADDNLCCSQPGGCWGTWCVSLGASQGAPCMWEGWRRLLRCRLLSTLTAADDSRASAADQLPACMLTSRLLVKAGSVKAGVLLMTIYACCQPAGLLLPGPAAEALQRAVARV